jgi:tetratricopeptide (TPR) repeat protein
MRFQNIRRNWKLLLAIAVFSFLDSLLGFQNGLNETVKTASHISFGLFVAWAFYKMSLRLRIALAVTSGRTKDALKLCQQEIANCPDDTDLKITAAGLSVRLSKPAEAVQFADAALLLDPQCTRAFLNRSIARAQMNMFDEALEDCNRGIESCSGSKAMQAHMLWARASVYVQKGEYQKSIDDCNSALDLDPKCLIALLGRSSAYCFSKQYSEAMNDLEAAAKLSSAKNIEAIILCKRARVNLCLGKLDIALEEAATAARMIPDLPAFPSTLGLVLTRKQSFEKALAVLNQAIEIDPLYAEAYWFRHELFKATGQMDKAESDKETALKYRYKPYL